MNNFKDGGFKKRGNDFGGRPKFGGDRGGFKKGGNGGFRGGDRGGRDNLQAESFSATCSECRKNCTVPFKPNGDKPVFCSACFGMKKEGRPREERGAPRQDNWGFKKPHSDNRPTFTEVPRSAPNTDIADIKKQLGTIEQRLNRILDLINPPKAPTKSVPAETLVVDPIAVKKPKIKAIKVEASKTKKVVKKVVKKK